jgi:integrase
LDLPETPTLDDLEKVRKWLDYHQKLSAKKTSYYIDKTEVVGSKVIIFKHSQKKNNFWYMRMYCGNKKYKQVSLNELSKEKAKVIALEEWRKIQNVIDSGAEVFTSSIDDLLDKYDNHLQQLVDVGDMKLQSVRGKRTSLKKLRLLLQDFTKPMDVPSDFLSEYMVWRRTKNWDKSKHKNNPKPPSDLTINKELTDFKGFFDWCNDKKYYTRTIQYPFKKVNYKLEEEKNPSFLDDDWYALVMYLRSWVNLTHTPAGNPRKNLFYRKVFSEWFKILGNSGMRGHESCMLRWCDVELRKRVIERRNGKKEEKWGSIIQIPADTKTGRREVICPAGVYFKRVHQLYVDEGHTPKPDDYIFRNIGTIHSRADHYVGKPLTYAFLRKLWYELLQDFARDTNHIFLKKYTPYSTRSFFINTKLEMGVPPSVVGEIVGHTLLTMEKHYKKLKIRNMSDELMMNKRRKLEESDFETWDLDQQVLPSK